MSDGGHQLSPRRQIDRVREQVVKPAKPGERTQLRLSFLGDYSEGQSLEVPWERETSPPTPTPGAWTTIPKRGLGVLQLLPACAAHFEELTEFHAMTRTC